MVHNSYNIYPLFLQLCDLQRRLILCFLRGVAARALHLSRGVEKPSGRVTYIVVLEGLCRFNVQELSTRGTYYSAKISPLEMTKAGNSSILKVIFHFNEEMLYKLG